MHVEQIRGPGLTRCEAGRQQPGVRACPGFFETLLYSIGFGVLFLSTQRLLESIERPAVARVVEQVVLVDTLCIRGTTGFEQNRAEDVAYGNRPRLGLIIVQAV